ncbi:HD-GYP domain-containing protein [Bacillus sp. Marseille-Q3570]|uniref:HD-GYP domain-containing protein n=1 Tax=Bacillus sp. Marseille-Q3570 TaxID=2963522 RepID=UPI0021B7004B|nr:HD-GYP domain-containing protein [Bacillus sp. Marseille-Q3570]
MNQKSLEVGTRLKADIYSQKGVLLLKEGTLLKHGQIDMLKKYDWCFDGDRVSALNVPVPPEHLISSNNTYIHELYNQTVKRIRDFFSDVLVGKNTNAKKMFDQFSVILEEVLKDEEHAVSLIYEVKNYDEVTYRHSVNVGLVAGLIGKILNLTHEEILLLGKMGVLHDIGKMKVHQSIVQKPERLNNEEYEAIKLHTTYGYELLCGIPQLEKMVPIGALVHHERLNGTGYPDGRMADEIPFLVQVLSIADIYDAICTERSYHKGRSTFIAIEQLSKEAEAGKINRTVVKEFIRFLMKLYVGKRVVLNTGEEGIVAFIPFGEPQRPLLKASSGYLDLQKVTTLSIVDFAAERI